MKATSLANRATRALGAAVLGAALLSGCGGSTSQVDQFQPERVLSFGDEMSYLSDSGNKYSVNALNTDKTLNCAGNPIWTQYLVQTAYAKYFSQCTGTATSPDTTAYRLSANGARVDDVVAAIESRLSSGDIVDSDLVTVMVGMHDVLDQYALYDGSNEADLTAELTARGEKLAAIVNTATGSGARVLVSTIIDLGLTPYALTEKADVGDDRPALLTRLTDAFNKAMRLGLNNDGSKIGLLLGDDLSRAMVRVPSSYALANVITPACQTSTWRTSGCTTDTLITDATSSPATYLWADDLHPASTYQLYLGQQAVSRLSNLPF